jgi:hypothetical protein
VGHKWLIFSDWNYHIIFANKMATVTCPGKPPVKDKFTEMGNSQRFVKGIPDSSGIEEDNVQVYAIPYNAGDPSVSDPGSNQSTLLIMSVENVSGQPFGYGYLINATTTQGTLNYTITHSSGGLSINAGDNALNASVSFFSATPQGYSVSQTLNVSLAASQTINFPAFYIANAAPSKTVVGQGYSNNINVTVANKGNSNETFNLNVYANQTLIGSLTNVSLASASTTTIPFAWKTSGFAKGKYFISACTTPVLGEINTTNNQYMFSLPVYVAIVGDIASIQNGKLVDIPKGKVDMLDVGLVASKFGKRQGQPGWDPNCDLTGPKGVPDGRVDMLDVGLVASMFGKTDP